MCGERGAAVRVTKIEGDSTCSASHEMVLVSLGSAKKICICASLPSVLPSQSTLQQQTSVARTKGVGFIRPKKLNRLFALCVRYLLFCFILTVFSAAVVTPIGHNRF